MSLANLSVGKGLRWDWIRCFTALSIGVAGTASSLPLEVSSAAVLRQLRLGSVGVYHRAVMLSEF